MRALLIELAHGVERVLALVLGGGTHRLELPADRGGAGAGGLGHHAGDVAGALFGGGKRFIEQAREARQPLVEIGGTQVDGGDQRFQRRLALGHRGRGRAVGLLDDGCGLHEGLAVAVELARQRVEVDQRLGGLVVEYRELVFQRLGRHAVAGRDVVHRGDEVGNAGDQRPLQRIEVVLGAGEHFLQEDVALAQALEQRDRVGAQDLAGLLHLGDGGNGDLARLVDRRARGLLQLLQRLADGAGGELAGRGDRTGHVGAVGAHRLGEGLAAGLDRLQRVRSDAVDLGRQLVGLGGERLDQRAAAAVDHLRQAIGGLSHIGDDLVGLAGHGRAEARGGGEHRTFDVGRGRLDLGGDLV